MPDDFDDMLDYFLSNPPSKEKPVPVEIKKETPAVEVKAEPEKQRKSKDKRKGEQDELSPELIYGTVRKIKEMPVCGTCRNRLKAGEKHWSQSIIEDGKKLVWWWCTSCIAKWCKLLPPRE